MNQLTVYFDGGKRPTGAYGSWRADLDGVTLRQEAKSFGEVTSNVAEYMSLIQALAWLEQHVVPKNCDLRIFGDSALVVNQSSGNWKVGADHLKLLCMEVQHSMRKFKQASIHWHRRHNSMRIFGH